MLAFLTEGKAYIPNLVSYFVLFAIFKTYKSWNNFISNWRMLFRTLITLALVLGVF